MPYDDNIPGYDSGQFGDPNYGPMFQPNDRNRVSQGGVRRGEFQALSRLPYTLMGNYNDIAKYGIYGQGGIESIMSGMRASNARRTQAIGKGMRRKMGRRLGSRSGAVMGMVANRLHAPQQIQLNETYAGLRRENLESRSSVGLRNIQRLMDFLQERYGNRWWENRDKDNPNDPGTLEKISGIMGSVAEGATAFGGAGGSGVGASGSGGQRYGGGWGG